VIFWLCTWAVLASEAAAFGTFDGWYDYYYGDGVQSAVDCIKASAGLGALVWILFVITLAFFGKPPSLIPPASFPHTRN
jgi:hypothetical protein